MKFLLLDINDTIAPLRVGGPDMVTIDSMGVELSIPNHIANWLKKTAEKEIKIFWCTENSSIFGSLVERTIGFKTEGQLQLNNKSAYNWNKLYGIIEFCNAHENDIVVLADNFVEKMTKGVELPSNLKLVLPSDATLTSEDLNLIERLFKI